jgi:hypothetical protein
MVCFKFEYCNSITGKIIVTRHKYIMDKMTFLLGLKKSDIRLTQRVNVTIIDIVDVKQLTKIFHFD